MGNAIRGGAKEKVKQQRRNGQDGAVSGNLMGTSISNEDFINGAGIRVKLGLEPLLIVLLSGEDFFRLYE